MLEKFVSFFIIFGLSYLLQILGLADQGKAFVYLDLGSAVVGLLLLIVAKLFLFVGDSKGKRIKIIILVLLLSTLAISMQLFIAWVATIFFNIDFWSAYQIMILGQCLLGKSNSQEYDDIVSVAQKIYGINSKAEDEAFKFLYGTHSQKYDDIISLLKHICGTHFQIKE